MNKNQCPFYDALFLVIFSKNNPRDFFESIVYNCDIALSHKKLITRMLTKIADFPKIIPVLPVQGAALFPRGHLPLPIVTPKHFSLVAEIWHTNKYIGIIQLNPESSENPTLPALFSSGTLGKITEINDYDDGKLFANIQGICRFDLIREVEANTNVRRAEVSYEAYEADLVHELDFNFDRPKLLRELGKYFKRLDIDANWEEITSVPDDKLITALAMACPFTQVERQAILQCASIKEQSQLITALLEMANREPNIFSVTCH